MGAELRGQGGLGRKVWLTVLCQKWTPESQSRASQPSITPGVMDAHDVNYLNELLEQDVEIREVRRLQMATPQYMTNPFPP